MKRAFGLRSRARKPMRDYLKFRFMAALLTLGTLCAFGCKSSGQSRAMVSQPEKFIIHYIPFISSIIEEVKYVDGLETNPCECVLRCSRSPVKVRDRSGKVICDSIVIDDFAAVRRLWSISQDTLSFKKEGRGRFHNARVCLMFYKEGESPVKTIALSQYTLMQIDGRQYRRDINLFNEVVSHLPPDYLLMPTWLRDTGKAKDTVDYYYDAETDWYKSATGEYLYGDECIVLQSKITGNPADSGYYERLRARQITADSTDTGYYYIDIKSRLYGEPAETLYRSQ